MVKLTPAMQQYLDIKEKHKDAILFFRMGDFYEMFFEDAELASRLLGITLTSRAKNKDNGIPMCGFPHHAAGSYVARLVKGGHKVAICDQVEDPKDAKGIVKREVIKVVTPGVALDEEILDSKRNNFIVGISVALNRVGMAYMDVTTGKFGLSEFPDIYSLVEEINKIEPAEMLVSDRFAGQPEFKPLQLCNTTILPYQDFNYDTSLRRILRHFEMVSLEGLGCAEMNEGVKAAGALLFYVSETQCTDLKHVKKLIPFYPRTYMVIDNTTKRNLEIMKSLRDGSKQGTLLSFIDKTKTAGGGRKLREWINYPLMNVAEIRKRQDSISEILDNRELRKEIQTTLSKVYDLERLMGRVALCVANPMDLIALKGSLMEVPKVKALLKGLNSTLLKGILLELDEVPEALDLITRAILDSPPLHIRVGGMIKQGYNLKLDELKSTSSNGKDWITRLEAKERERTGIGSLRVAYNRVFGYYIEVTRSHLSNIPSDYIRKQTLVNAERFITPDLKEWESVVIGAEEKVTNLELELFQEIRQTIGEYVERVQNTASLIAGLDVIAALAQLADEMNYVRPSIDNGDTIQIIDGRHPVIEASLEERFIPNDLLLDNKDNQLIILTGPNMAGKSTYMRQAALIVFMAQIGSFVPAASAHIGVVDRVFTRVGASDDLTKGQSTFMVEMGETANILNSATPKSLIILDEIGRGTSTYDGLSIAWSVAEYIHDNPQLHSKTLFATHYHELTELSMTKERVKNFSMAVKEWNDKIIFLRKVVPGGTNRSYGIQVARLAGLPRGVLARAKEILSNLEKGELNDIGMPRIAGSKDSEEIKGQMGLFGERDLLKTELKELDPNNITPMEALQILSRFKGMVEN